MVFLAGATGNPILPYHIEASRHWTLGSWDRTQIPKPFSTVALVIGEPIVVETTDESTLERKILEVGSALGRLEARALVKKDGTRPVPLHLRNAPTKLMKELGHGKAYRYAHDEPEAYAAGETYLPDGMREPDWYQPVPRGLEAKIADKLAHLRALDDKARDGG